MLPYFPKLEEISISRRSQSKQVEEESNSEEPVSDASLAIHDPRLEKQELDELVWVDPLELNTTKYKGEKTVTPDGQIIWSFLKLNMEIKYCLQPKPRVKKNNSSTLAKLHLHVSVYNPSIVSIHGPFSRTVSSTNRKLSIIPNILSNSPAVKSCSIMLLISCSVDQLPPTSF